MQSTFQFPRSIYHIISVIILILSLYACSSSTTDANFNNPFPREDIKFRYIPRNPTCGNSFMVAQKSESDGPIQTIRKVFEKKGIQLQEDYLFEEKGISVYLTGYSEVDNIGFLYLDFYNLDPELTYKSFDRKLDADFISSHKSALHTRIDKLTKQIDSSFERFLKDKNKYIEDKSNPRLKQEDYLKHLKTLAAEKQSKTLITKYYIENSTKRLHSYLSNYSSLVQKEIFNYFDEKLELSITKLALLKFLGDYKINQPGISISIITDKFDQIIKSQPDDIFLEQFFTLYGFLLYGNSQVKSHQAYSSLKAKLFTNNTIENLFSQKHHLDEMRTKIFITDRDLENIYKMNKKGRKHIVVISAKGHLKTPNSTAIEQKSRNRKKTLLKLKEDVKMYFEWAKL